MARNRCSYEKRAKEIARKQKQEEKIKRRQNKIGNNASEDTLASEFEGEVLETEPEEPKYSGKSNLKRAAVATLAANGPNINATQATLQQYRSDSEAYLLLAEKRHPVIAFIPGDLSRLERCICS